MRGWLGRKRFRRFITGAISVLLLGIIVGYVDFIHHINEQITNASTPKADGIVVLTGDERRIATGVELFHKIQAKRLLISGVHELTTRKDLGSLIGDANLLTDCCIDIDRDARDTRGNAKYTAKWAKDNGFKRLIVVTSDYHMPRSLMLFKQQMPDLEMMAVPVKSIKKPDHFILEYALSSAVMREYAKYLAARFGIDPPVKQALSVFGSKPNA